MRARFRHVTATLPGAYQLWSAREPQATFERQIGHRAQGRLKCDSLSHNPVGLLSILDLEPIPLGHDGLEEEIGSHEKARTSRPPISRSPAQHSLPCPPRWRGTSRAAPRAPYWRLKMAKAPTTKRSKPKTSAMGVAWPFVATTPAPSRPLRTPSTSKRP